jgi:cell division transport system ATP-binding protein
MTSMAEESAVIRMFHVHKRYGAKQALVDATLDIAKNEFLFISGPSGGREINPAETPLPC